MFRVQTTSNGAQKKRIILSSALVALAACLPLLAIAGIVHANTLTSASATLSDPRPSATSSYDVLVSNLQSSTIKCVKEVYSLNADGTGSIPGFSASGASFTASGSTMFSSPVWTPSATANSFSYSNATGAAPSSTTGAHYIVGGITNGNTVNTGYFLTFSTYGASDCSTTPLDSVVTQFIFINGQQVTIGVDPSLSFALAGVTGNGSLTVNGSLITNGLATTASTIPFGTLVSTSNKVASQNVTVSTNAANGYTVYVRYTAKPTVNSFTIDDLNTGSATNTSPATFSAAGTEGFGYTTSDTSLAGTATRFSGGKWASFTTTNAEVAYNSGPVSNDATQIGFQAGIAGSTEPGSYTTTVIYTATPVY